MFASRLKKRGFEQMIKQLYEDFHSIGIEKGDLVLIHSSYKAMGEIEGGAKAFFDALISYLGESGTLVLPALSFDTVTFDEPYFNAKNTPSCVGYLTEYFRTNVEGVIRSIHATHSCCARGRLAREICKDHEKDETPVGENSPFRKLPLYDGKILFIGCSTDRNTSMHGVEEIADPPYWLDRNRSVEYSMEDENGNIIKRRSFRHDFVIDGKHIEQCYSRIEKLLNEDEIRHGRILQAESTMMMAKAVWSKGVEKMKQNPWYFVSK